MKKILSLFTVILIGITLTGCSLLPEDIEAISEEFCRENPTNEICAGDLIDNLEDQAVLDMFDVIIAQYNDDTNTSFCDDYFSVTNIELLDECRLTKEDLVPLDFINFSVEGIEKQNTISTENVYDITTVSEDLLTEVIFTIGVVNVENSMYISTWSYEIITIDPTTLDVPFAEAEAYFAQFVDDYFNKLISSEVVCVTYFPEDEYCLEDRTQALEDNVVMNLLSSTDLGEGMFEFEFEAVYGTESHTDSVQLFFSYDVDGNIVMEFDEGEATEDPYTDYTHFCSISPDAQICADDYIGDEFDEDIFKLFYAISEQYMEPDFSVLCTDLFINTNPELQFACESDISLLFPDEYDSYIIIDIINLDPYSENKVYEIYTVDEETYSNIILFIIGLIEIDGVVYVDSWEYIVEPDYIDPGNVPMDDAVAYFMASLEDYYDDTLSSEDVCAEYFSTDDGCIEIRDMSLLEDPTITILDVYDNYDGSFDFSLWISFTDDEFEQTITIFFYYDEFDNIIMQFEYEKDPAFDVDFYLAEELIVNLVYDFNNFELSNEEVCFTYFEYGETDECIIHRDQAKFTGLTLNLVDIIQDGDFFIIHFVYLIGSEVFEEEIIFAHIYYNEFDELKISFIPDSILPIVDYITAEIMFVEFLEHFIDPSISTQEFCELYFPGADNTDCFWNRAYLQLDSIYFNLVSFQNDYGRYEAVVEIEMPLLGEVITYNANIDFYYDEAGNLIMDIWEPFGLPEHLSYEEAVAVIEMFFIEMMDPTISWEYLVTTYFDEIYVDDSYSEERLNDLANGFEMILIEVIDHGDKYFGFYEVIYEITNGGVTTTETVWLRVYSLDDGTFILEDDMYVPMNGPSYEEAYILLSSYYEDYYWDAISSDEFCNNYFEGEYVDICIAEREFSTDDAPFMIFVELYNDFEIWTVELILEYNDGHRETIFVDAQFYYNEYMELKIDFYYGVVQEIPIEDVYYAITQFYLDVFDTSIGTDEFCELYSDYFSDCHAEREMILTQDFVYVVDFWHIHSNNYAVLIAGDNLFGDGYAEIEVYFEAYIDLNGNVRFNFTGDLEPNPEENYLASNLAEELYIEYINDYFNPDISNQELADIYFNGEIYLVFESQREFDLSTIVEYHLEYFITPSTVDEGGFIEAGIFIQRIDTTDFVVHNFRVISYDDGSFFLEFEYTHYHPQLDFDSIVVIIENYFFSAFNESYFSSSDMCAIYHDGIMLDECIAYRDQLLDYGYTIELEWISQTGESISIDIGIGYYLDGVYLFSTEVEALFYVNSDGLIMFDMIYPIIDIDEIYYEIYDSLVLFAEEFAYDHIASEEFCYMFTDDSVSCISLRDDLLAQGVVSAFLVDFYPANSEGNYIVEIEFLFEDEHYELWVFEVIPYYSDIDGVLVFNLVVLDSVPTDHTIPFDAVLIDYDLANQIMLDFYYDLADPAITNEEICNMYFNGEFNDMNCGQDRLDLLASNPVTTVISFVEAIDEAGNVYYIAEVEFVIDGESYIFYEMMGVYALTNGNIYIEFLFDVSPAPDPGPDYDLVIYDVVVEVYETFILEFNDATFTDEYICANYSYLLDPMLYCNPDRQLMLTEGIVMVIDDIQLLNDPLYGDYYEVIISIIVDEIPYSSTYSVYIFYDETGVLVIETVCPTYFG